MPRPDPSSAGIEATIARVAPAVLALLGDGVPRSRRAVARFGARTYVPIT